MYRRLLPEFLPTRWRVEGLTYLEAPPSPISEGRCAVGFYQNFTNLAEVEGAAGSGEGVFWRGN